MSGQIPKTLPKTTINMPPNKAYMDNLAQNAPS